jgi:asparagine synthase (glutamine-hydrolysing)
MSGVIQSVLAESLTYLDELALHELHDRVAEVERANRPGVLIEAGCALGGSAIVMAAAKSKERPFHVYDVFGLIPPPSEHDGPDVHERYRTIRSGESSGIGGNRYYGYEANLLGKVKENFRRHGLPAEEHNIHLVQGLFEDTLHVRAPVALAHLDGDWYHSVLTCLRRIEPHLGPAGVLVIDDYDAWSGCRKAVDEYFADKSDRYQFVHGARLQIIRR